MKTLKELKELRSNMLDRFYEEGTKLTGWSSEYLAKVTKKAEKEEDYAFNEEWRELKANSSLLGALSSAITALDKMIKDSEKNTSKQNTAVFDALDSVEDDE